MWSINSPCERSFRVPYRYYFRPIAVAAQQQMAQPSCKPKSSTEAPWGSFDVPQTLTSTYASAYIDAGMCRPREKIIPKPAHEWGHDLKFEGRSTAQDAYTNHNSYMMRPSCKPEPKVVATPWMTPLTTTAGSHFTAYSGTARTVPFRPKASTVDLEVKFETRSTQQDAYPAMGYVRPPKPFLPKEQPRDNLPFEHTSTSRAAYIPHEVMPYVKARKPSGAGDPFGA